MCLSSLQVNASVLWTCTFFRWWWWKSGSSLPEDERDVCAPLSIHYSHFRCLLHTPLLLYTFLAPFHPHPPPHLPTPPLHCYSNLALDCQIPLSMAQWSHLHPQMSTNRIKTMLKGFWWTNWNKWLWISQRLLYRASLTDFLVANLIRTF